jgi:hypothetical protein
MKRGRDRDVVDIAHACGIEQHLMLDETMSPAGPKLYLWGLALCDSHNSFHISQSLCKKGAPDPDGEAPPPASKCCNAEKLCIG